jgi:hypothetical protein
MDGWLDRDGVFYKCPVWGHIEMAKEICKLLRLKEVDPKLIPWSDRGSIINAERELERRGWVKMSSDEAYYGAPLRARSGYPMIDPDYAKPTKAQRDFVLEHYAHAMDACVKADNLRRRDSLKLHLAAWIRRYEEESEASDV